MDGIQLLVLSTQYSLPRANRRMRGWVLSTRCYFSFGGSVRPNTEMIPWPATFTFASAGFGRYRVPAMFAAVDFRVRSPGFLRVAAGALHYIGGVKPALQMAAGEFALFVFLVAGALPLLS